MPSFSVFLDFIGCRLNEAELQMWAHAFARHGARLVARNGSADVVVINSCTVTAEAARKSRQRIRRLRRDYPDALLVVTGCYSSMADPAELRSFGADLLVPNADKDQLADQVMAHIEATKAAGSYAADTHVIPLPLESHGSDLSLLDESPYQARGMQRAFIKIQDGCRYRCTYCIVTLARGAERSRSVADILDDIARVEADSIYEIVLSGVHIGGYGSDSKQSLPDLLDAILNQTKVARIRLSSLEPWHISDRLLDLLSHPRVMPHLHLPVQSGADSVLKRMARRGKAADFYDIAERYYRWVPAGMITTDIIAGFPGETEAEWQATLDLVKETRLAGVHCFPFSPRAGTIAVTLPGRVDAEQVRARCDEMSRVSGAMMQQAARSLLGQTATVLWEQTRTEEQGGERFAHGLIPQFMKVKARVDAGEDLSGRLANVVLTEFDLNDACFLGKLVF